jgi:hypothetical protein
MMKIIGVMPKRSLSQIVEEDMHLDHIKMPNPIWRHLDDVPRDGTPFVVKLEHSFRWVPYVNENQATTDPKIVQRIDGKLGRWQTFDAKGNWTNCKPPEGVWRNHD